MPFTYGYWIDPPRCGMLCRCENYEPCFKWQTHRWAGTSHFYPTCPNCSIRTIDDKSTV